MADELLGRGEPDAAVAFAAAATRVDTQALPAYVAAQRGRPDNADRRAQVARANVALASKEFAEVVASLAEQRADDLLDVVGVRLAIGRALALGELLRLEPASAQAFAAGEAAERLGWLARADWAFAKAGVFAFRSALAATARTAFERALATAERRGERVRTAQALGNLANAHLALSEYTRALPLLERARAAYEALGNRVGEAGALGGIGLVHSARGEHALALTFFERARAMFQAEGDLGGAAEVLGSMASNYELQTDLPRALAAYEGALAELRAVGRRDVEATILFNLANLRARLGDLSQALSLNEQAHDLFESLGNRGRAALALSAAGLLRWRLGDYDVGLRTLERAHAEMEATHDRRGMAQVDMNSALIYAALGDHARALALYEGCLTTFQDLGDRATEATLHGNIATSLRDLGRLTEALASHELALTQLEALHDAVGVARTLGNIAAMHLQQGDPARAVGLLERALKAKEELGLRASSAGTLGNLGSAYLALGDPRKALEVLHRAVALLASTVQGLGAEEGAGAREPMAFIYEVGARAALAASDPGELTYFLENGRAGALLEGLESGKALRSATLAPELRAREAEARAAENAAMKALAQAVGAGDRVLVRSCKAELDRAREQVSLVVARLQREVKAGAALIYAEGASLAELQATLREGDTLVLYGLAETEMYALVVTATTARGVALGPSKLIEGAVTALALDQDRGDPAEALAALATRVVAPLGMPASTRRVFVSPIATLGYVPFAPLLPEVAVVYVPSGSAYRLLLGEQERHGEGVLALGDPDYRGNADAGASSAQRLRTKRLAQLPATRAEAQAVGDVTLLGAEATKAGLVRALAQQARWRAVHLACHGLIDPERPARSALALTATPEDDGFLSALDVFRIQVPADLVVLSACETGKGKLVKSEGIVGLTRAFMFAGAPRVVCSLWKVDDEATQALMLKFYELWNPRAQPEDPGRAKRVDGSGTPGLPAAQALREAQAYVRAQERWNHPYYWAAWVLWGLP